MRVFLVPRYELKDYFINNNIPIDASVEAEYGSEIIEGDITLAHHIDKYKDNPAPCMQKIGKLDDSKNIIISHIDLDTLGGCAALMGLKHENEEFWSAVEYIDLNGPHHLNELEESIRNMIIAYNSYAAINHMDKVNDVVDVTSIIIDRINTINKILEGDTTLINEGIDFYRNEQLKINNCLLVENPNIRVFYSKQGLFCSASYYSDNYKKIIPYIISYNGFYNSITVSSEDGGKLLSCKTLVQELWGSEAGGHNGIAGSPRNIVMTNDDFVMITKILNERLNNIYNTNYELDINKIRGVK